MARTLMRSRTAGPVASPDGEEPSAEATAPQSRRRRRLFGAAAVVVVLAVAAVVVATLGGGEEADDAQGGSSSIAEVAVRTLTQTEAIEGTLDFGDVHSLSAGRDGTLTSAAAAGTTVDRGGELFSVDRRPTVLLLGDVPLYRELGQGVEDGPDVAQLESNLAALGFTDDGQMVVDEHFDAPTTDAVEAWQEAGGVEVTGVVAPGDAVFLSGPVRMAEPRLDLGATVQTGSAVVDYTASTQVVRVQLEIAQADLAQVGDQVTVTLPDGREVAGTVAAIADTGSSSDQAAAGSSSDQAADSGASAQPSGETGTEGEAATVDVTVSIVDPAAVAAFTTASVDVLFTSGQAEDVLAVPVTALLAVLGGGYAVEVPSEDGTSRLVPVEPGLFADGYVEITGEGIEDGMQVVVPE